MKQFIDQYTKTINETIASLDDTAFSKIIDILCNAYKQDKQIFMMGNGGSAASANHFVCDFGKNAVSDPAKRRFRILSVCDNIEKITALGNDISFDEVFRQQLINLMREEDVLIVISASGNSPDLVKACEYAEEMNGHIITLSGFDGGMIKEFAEASMVVPLESYEQIEDVHMLILHMIVYYMKNHPENLD